MSEQQSDNSDKRGPSADVTPIPGRVMITAALLMAMTVTALEQLVVSTAMPSIIATLQGLEIYPWVTSAYLLASTITAPLYGKFADLYGRKKVLLFGLGLFTLGSMLSGLATSMGQLIAMRVIQGLGAGAVGPIVLTMLSDLFSLQERAKVQSLFSAVWGISSLAGPAIGGVLTESLSWRWVFFVTLPFSIGSAIILVIYVQENVQRKAQVNIDWLGATLLAIGSSALLLTALQGQSRSMLFVLTLGLFSLVVLGLFVIWERRVTEPILPLDLLVRKGILPAIVGNFLLGAITFGLDQYIPLYVQGVLGGSAIQAGSSITPLFLSWAISVAIAAKVVVRYGFRKTAMVGSVFVICGMLTIAIGSHWRASTMPCFFAGMFVIGLGMGPASLSYILGIQNVVEWGERGVATGALIFFRSIGAALGVGVLGAGIGWSFTRRLVAGGVQGIEVSDALRPETHALLGVEILRLVQESLGAALQQSYVVMVILTMFAFVCSSRLPRHTKHQGPSGEQINIEDDEVPLAAIADH